MMQFRAFIFLASLLLSSVLGFGQTEVNKHNQPRLFSLAPGLQTNGFGINFKWSRSAGQSRFTYFNFDLGKIKHPKEFRYMGNGRYNGFVFGRKNVTMPLRLGIGKNTILGVRNSKNDVGVAWSCQGGLSMALMKPVYLYVVENTSSGINTEVLVKYSDETNIDISSVMGGAPFFNGFNQLQVVPGVYGKVAMLFSWGKFYSDYNVLELGFLTEAFSKKLPMMAHTSNEFIYPAFYINFNVGKLW